jgi:hypothetical protein
MTESKGVVVVCRKGEVKKIQKQEEKAERSVEG